MERAKAMPATFWRYRYFLNETRQGVLPFQQGKNKKALFLAALKSDKVKSFSHGKSSLGFLIEQEENGFLYCKFGKRTSITRRLPPKDRFKEEHQENWPTCHLFLDTRDDSNGQQIAIERRSAVFPDPLDPLRGLADEINRITAADGFEVSINPITEETDFWAMVKAKSGHIEALEFVYRAPNLFHLGSKLEDELKKLKLDNGVTEARVKFSNPEGKLNLPHDDDLTQQSVEYIAKGGGEYRLRAEKKWFRSRDKVVSKTVHVNLETNDRATIAAAIRELFQ